MFIKVQFFVDTCRRFAALCFNYPIFFINIFLSSNLIVLIFHVLAQKYQNIKFYKQKIFVTRSKLD